MTISEADDAIEASFERVGNARNLINPDILRAMLANIERDAIAWVQAKFPIKDSEPIT